MSRETNLELNTDDNDKPSAFVKNVTAAYNIVGVMLSLYILFSEGKNNIIVLLPYPLIAIVLVLISKRAVKLISDNNNRIYGSLTFGFLFSTLIILFKSWDYTIFKNENVWLPVIITCVVIFILLYKIGINPLNGRKIFETILTYIIVVIYAYGVIREANSIFDKSNPQIYRVVVLDKRAHHGSKSDSYHFTLSTWGPMQTIKEEEVDGYLFDHTKIGDTINVNFSQGLLDIPWYAISK